jgi:hypothetical protein
VLFRQLVGYVLMLFGSAAFTAVLIMVVVRFRLSRASRAAEPWPLYGCAQVRAGSGPLHLHGASAPGPAGLLRARLSRSECVWYRERVLRRYWVTRMRLTNDEWQEVTLPAQEVIWEWDSGPFALRDETGSVLVAPALLDRTLNAHGHPVQRNVVNEVRDSGAEAGHYQSGELGVLLAHRQLPAGLLDRFAEPDARTYGYCVQEDILRPSLPFRVFAVPADLDGEPIMATPFKDVWAISAEPMSASLARGGKRATGWAVWIGLASLACFVVAALLLLPGALSTG